jgi:hypothetical protein
VNCPGVSTLGLFIFKPVADNFIPVAFDWNGVHYSNGFFSYIGAGGINWHLCIGNTKQRGYLGTMSYYPSRGGELRFTTNKGEMEKDQELVDHLRNVLIEWYGGNETDRQF